MEGSELPAGWEISTLGEVAGKGQYGWTTKASTCGSVKLLRTTDITKGPVNWETVPFCQENPDEIDKYVLSPGDIVVSRAGSVGFASLIGEVPVLCVFASYLIRFTPNTLAIIPKYLNRFLHSPEYWNAISGASAGIALANVNASKLSLIRVPLAPLSEQRRIAAKLDTSLAAVDACRQRLDGVAAILKRFRQAVLTAATSGELTREWREERGMEKDWLVTCLSDIADIQGGLTKDSKKQDPEDPELPYLRVANVQRGYLDLREMAFIRVPRTRFDALLLQDGDILFNEGGDRDKVGRGWIWEGQITECVFQNHVFRARLLNQGNQPKFVSWWANTCGASHFLGRGKQTTNLASISKTTLGLLPIQLPCAAEQEEIVRRVETFFTLADQLEARLTSARKVVDRLTPALLAKAFRGELVPQDPGDEPASVLLERIRAARQAEAGAGKPSRRGRPKAAANPDQLPLDAAPVPPDFLAGLLREFGPLSERALWAVSELEPQRFQQQLYRELESGTAREVQDNGQVLLEAVG
jgi:type I restriction enzyme S subunit